ncbi:synphilin-1 [Caerostris extrusa]|uniref:Synphilin-1 n=1 Tax=Caerostris extrusa TaxID=172846 RepID=A0AAV4PCG9_CAEEX|nr:synphilin-1 [Caerostris extrusa]
MGGRILGQVAFTSIPSNCCPCCPSHSFCLSPTTISYLAQLKVQPVYSVSMSSCNANGTLRVRSVWVSLGILLAFCNGSFCWQLFRMAKKSHASKTYRTDNLPYERKQTSWSHSNKFNGYFQDNKMLEEFILDDNELCLLNYYDIPLNVPKRHVRNSGKVKTVSIIDTLSELASGATDREDEGGFSSAVSESAVLNRYLHKPKARHAQSIDIKERLWAKFYSIYSPSLDDAGLPCSSLKRTLKCLRKAVASNVAEEEIRNRKHVKEKTNNEDAFRLLSDPFAKSATKPSSIFQSRSKASVPDWIQEVFTASKKGNVDKMKSSLKDIDPALVRNLSDDHGNNLWHIFVLFTIILNV